MSFKTRRFDHVADKPWYEAWWYARGYEKGNAAPMPKVAIVVTLDEQPVAAGGITLTDSDFCMPEGFCTNPLFESEIRDGALKTVGLWALETAISMGYKRALMITTSSKILDVYKDAASYGIINKGIGFKVTDFSDHKVYELKRE